MGFLPIFPMIYAAHVAHKHSPARAFLQVYIPVLLLLPMYFRWVLPALPDPTFEQATILPIAAIFLMRNGKNWKFSFGDVLMLAYAGVIGTSQYLNTNYNEAQNEMFDMVASVLFPYMLAKGLIEPEGMSQAVAKKMVMMMFWVSIVSVYEFRLGLTPWLILRIFYPGQGLEWGTSFRYGFARIAGPYGHAILAGLVFAVGYRLHRWLEWSGAWEPRFPYPKWLRVSKAHVITVVLLGGIVMTLVRGPWLGGFAGGLIVAVGRTRKRVLALLLIVGAVVLLGIPAASSFYAYASVGRAHAKTVSQETAAYRMELLTKYVNKAMERTTWGYGLNTWPKDPSAPSIDNFYLLLLLMHGMIAVGLLLTIMFTTMFRLIIHEMRAPPVLPLGSSLGFTLAAMFLIYFVTITTVYMGLQTIPLFSLLVGWSEGYLLGGRRSYSAATMGAAASAAPRFAFRRVVA